MELWYINSRRQTYAYVSKSTLQWATRVNLKATEEIKPTELWINRMSLSRAGWSTSHNSTFPIVPSILFSHIADWVVHTIDINILGMFLLLLISDLFYTGKSASIIIILWETVDISVIMLHYSGRKCLQSYHIHLRPMYLVQMWNVIHTDGQEITNMSRCIDSRWAIVS